MILEELREEIDLLNQQLIFLLGKRTQIAREIARIKKQNRLPVFDPLRENSIKTKVREMAKKEGLSPFVMEEIIQIVLDYTRLEMEIA